MRNSRQLEMMLTMWTSTFLCCLLFGQVVQSHAAGQFSQDPECGKTRGCYSDCASGCTYEVTWQDMRTYVTFTMKYDLESETSRWIALGLSQDMKMGSDEVVECHKELSGTVKMYRSRNTGKSPPSALSGTDLQPTQGSVDGSVLTCGFNLQKSASLDLDADSYLLFANGRLTGNVKSKHSTTPKISPNVVDLQSVQVIGGSAVQVLIKVHGLLMIAAWVLFASVGVVLARYYKPVWADRKLLGEKVWFQIHRLLMIMTLLFVVAAFIVIFVQVEGWSEFGDADDYKKAHPYLGVIVTALTIMNPLMALFRPHPDDKYRFIFNWAHWFVGTSARVLAVITIFIGVTLSGAGAPEYVLYILAAYTAYQLFIELVLEFHECFVVRANSGRESVYEMKKVSDPDPNSSEVVTRGEPFKKVAIGLHTLVIVGFTAAIMISVGIN
ncbi:ferric-chelate reductase 1-like [Saccostrea echinata]|uniref:ferric-chelate reductase 1-like n=1 Tax=Saccostrea echinata TaxID=191078 RepID=UPI002A80FE8B|nr:ferric-chelate reductase 1-like [Saccostrea echinata]